MSESIIVALITGAAAVLGNWLVSRQKSKEADIKTAVFQAEIKNEINDLRSEMKTVNEHLKEHNGYAKLFADASTDIALIKKDIEYLRSRP